MITPISQVNIGVWRVFHRARVTPTIAGTGINAITQEGSIPTRVYVSVMDESLESSYDNLPVATPTVESAADGES